MTMIRSEARRKGLRMAAHVAAISGVLAAAAAASQASEAKTPSIQGDPSATAGHDGAVDPAERLSGLVRFSRGGDCGCAPCWGPPAPPAMRPELLDLFDVEAAS